MASRLSAGPWELEGPGPADREKSALVVALGLDPKGPCQYIYLTAYVDAPAPDYGLDVSMAGPAKDIWSRRGLHNLLVLLRGSSADLVGFFDNYMLDGYVEWTLRLRFDSGVTRPRPGDEGRMGEA